MDDFFGLEMICRIARATVCVYQNGIEVFRPERMKENKIQIDQPNNIKLIRETENSESGVRIVEEDGGVLFACVAGRDAAAVIGPVVFESLDVVRLHQFYVRHGNKGIDEKQLPVMEAESFYSLVAWMAKEVAGKEFQIQELVSMNRLGQEPDVSGDEQEEFSIKSGSDERSHHTYEEERRLLQYVANGSAQDAVSMSMWLDKELGLMSQNKLSQWRQTAIIGIALCSRAAIEGGIPPARAYQLSDHYLQKLDQCREISDIIDCRNKAVEKLAQLVASKNETEHYSSHVEACRDYIEKNYRRKIYLEEVAESIGLAPTYLSRLFSKEMGMRFSDYLTMVRTEHAANLLKYSQMSVTEISRYVNFPSASYLGQIFKKSMGMTPKEYRNRYKPKEFIEKK